MKKYLFLLLLLPLGSCNTPDNTTSKVLLISFDGFRADYLQKTDTPNFDRLAANGVVSEGLIPVFPTKTFPNHYAIATGLYPENNGIVGNNMYDPSTGKSYSIGNRDAVEDPMWYEGEPIWNTVEKQGLKAGTMYWVGSETPVQDMRPTRWKSYDGNMPDSARIDSVVSWLNPKNVNVDLGTLYFSFVDSRGHRHGPDSPEVVQAIERADQLMGYLIEQLEQAELFDTTNLIIVSDHGMSEVSSERIVVLDDLIDPDKVEAVEYSPSLMLKVKEGEDAEVIYGQLKKQEEHFKVYRKSDIPDRYHLKAHERVPDLLMVAERGYTINTREYFNSRSGYPSGGAHGFDNEDPEMFALFIAHGPGFPDGKKIDPIENVNVYGMIAKLLNIQPAPNDGDEDRINEVLAE